MFKLGITGGIGSGKSSVCRFFAEQGIDIVEADDISREVVVPGSSCLKAIEAKFGREILLADGSLNRALMRERIFVSDENKHWLEALLHPAIRSLIIERLNSAKGPYCILSSPLMFETNQLGMVDRILVVDVPEAVQLERASARDGVTREQIQAIMNSQIHRDARLKRADDIIDNSGSLEETRKFALELHQKYLTISQYPEYS